MRNECEILLNFLPGYKAGEAALRAKERKGGADASGHLLRYSRNPFALDAVLADIQSQGEVDAYWALRDFAALGHDPVTPLEKVTSSDPGFFQAGGRAENQSEH
ncbi:MAG TPA: hypothetical protein VKQ36_05465 [Ktedonobacterales bacterium]|nr:hypothetical protein [Ktedonobacterales bacterium]